MAAPVGSSAQVQGDSNLQAYHQFCTDFVDLIRRGETEDAEALLKTNKVLYAGLLDKMKPFDAQIETLVQQGELLSVVTMAEVLQNQEVASDMIRAYRLGGLIALDLKEQASEYLDKNSALPDVARLYLTVYETLEDVDGPRRTLMNQVIAFRPRDPTVIDLRAALAMAPEAADKKE